MSDQYMFIYLNLGAPNDDPLYLARLVIDENVHQEDRYKLEGSMRMLKAQYPNLSYDFRTVLAASIPDGAIFSRDYAHTLDVITDWLERNT